MKKILSIVIPSKNRQIYLLDSIRSILNIKSELFEIIAHDNSINWMGELAELSQSDLRLKYFHYPHQVSSVENFNKALGHSIGEYVMMIGDDDTVNDKILLIVKWAKHNQFDCVRSRNIVSYFWPEYEDNPKSQLNQTIWIKRFSNKITVSNAKQELLLLLKKGGQQYYNFGLPKLYYGIVKREIMEQIKEKTGAYIKGLSPDIYTSVLLTKYCKSVIDLDYPFVIPGACRASTTSDNYHGKHAGSLGNAIHLVNNESYVWEKKIPKYYSVQTIWGETFLKALNEINHSTSLFNTSYLIASSLHKNKNIIKIIKREVHRLFLNNRKAYVFNWIGVIYYYITILFNSLSKRMVRKITRIGRGNDTFVHRNVASINAAQEIISRNELPDEILNANVG